MNLNIHKAYLQKQKTRTTKKQHRKPKNVRPQLDTYLGQLILEALTWQMGTRNIVLLERRHSKELLWRVRLSATYVC